MDKEKKQEKGKIRKKGSSIVKKGKSNTKRKKRRKT